MQKLKEEGKVFCNHYENEYGDYIKDNKRYMLEVNREIYAPDGVDLSMYKKMASKEAYVNKYMKSYEYKPLTEEERKAMEEAKHLEQEKSNIQELEEVKE